MHRGYTRSWRLEVDEDDPLWSMPPLYHRVFFYLRQQANSETKLMRMPRSLGMYVSAGMLVTSLQAIADGVAYHERMRKVAPNKKIIAEILRWLQYAGKIRYESNGLGTVIWLENADTYIETRQVKLTTKKQPSQGPGIDPASLTLAGMLASEILKNNPKHRDLAKEKREGTIARWAVDIGKLLHVDRQDCETVSRVIVFCQGHSFWKKNILSARTLREKWDRLVVEMGTSLREAKKAEIPPPKHEGDLLKTLKNMEKAYRYERE